MIDAFELIGEAKAEAQRIVAAWAAPTAKWPPGSCVEEARTRFKEHGWRVTTPCGDVFEFDLPEKPNEPHIVWDWFVDGCRLVAKPRIAQSAVFPADGTEARKNAMYRGAYLGLDPVYIIGKLSRAPIPVFERVLRGYDFW